MKKLLLSALYIIPFISQAVTYTGDDLESRYRYLDSIKDLNEVTVVENRRKEIIRSQTLSDSTLEQLNAHSVADALRYFSGVQVKDFGGIGGIKTINIRSMGSHHVGVFYDGIQLGNAQNGQIDLGRYSLDNIEEIALYNGQKSNIFQGAKDFGSSGTVYIRTRRPRWSGNERQRLTAQFSTGSFGLAHPEIVYEHRLSHTVSMSASAGYTYANGRYRFRYRRLNMDNTVAYDTTATRHNGDISALRAEVSVFGFMQQGSWSGKAYYYDSERGVPGAIVNNVFRNGERQWDRNFFVQGSLEYLFTDTYHLKVNAKWALDYLHYLRDDPKELYVNNRYHQKETYISTANLFRITPWWSATVSADLQWNTMTADLPNFLSPARFTEMIAIATSFDRGNWSAQASLLGTFIQDRTGNAHTQGRSTACRNNLSPALFASWKPVSESAWHINAFVKQSMRMPTFNDLYYTEIGNKELEPEYTMQYSFGSDIRIPLSHSFFKSIELQGNTYFNRVTNKIIAYPAGQQFRWTMLNLGTVEIFGAEISVESAIVVNDVNLHLRGNYTYQRARDVTDRSDSYYNHQIPYIPRHAFSINGGAEWRGWDLNYSFIYTGLRYSAQENTPDNLEQPWYTHDMSLFKSFRIKKAKMRAGIEINNLLNQDYEVIRNYPMPGRNFKITIKTTI